MGLHRLRITVRKAMSRIEQAWVLLSLAGCGFGHDQEVSMSAMVITSAPRSSPSSVITPQYAPVIGLPRLSTLARE